MQILDEIQDLESIPKELRENYQERDGKFVLTLVGGLKSALDKERYNARTAAHALATAEEKREGEISAAVAAREAALREEFGQTESTLTAKARDELNAAKKLAEATRALQKGGGNITLLEDKVTSQLGVDENGKVNVVDSSGTPLLDDDGNAISVDGLVTQMRSNPAFAGAFIGSGSTGGGAPPMDGGPGVVRKKEIPARRGQMTHRQKVDYINEHGEDAFMTLPA